MRLVKSYKSTFSSLTTVFIDKISDQQALSSVKVQIPGHVYTCTAVFQIKISMQAFD